MKNKNPIFYLILLLVLTLNSCKEKDEYHSVIEKIKAEQKPYHGKLTSETLLAGTDLIEITEGEHTFLIPERKGQIKSFACTECHNSSLSQMKSLVGKKAHWEIQLYHAPDYIMNCATCHNGEDMNSLNSLTGQSINLDLSYKVCAQCHSSQFEDWKGGAHGKKLAGWTPPRASMTCVNCHDPHKPSFDTRWPSNFNIKKALERKEGLDH